MNTAEIIEKFESKNSHEIWLATWEILHSNDKEVLKALMPSIPGFNEILKQVDMGGKIRSNASDTLKALKYIEDTFNGLCRCELYKGQNVFNPEAEEKLGHIKILKTEFFKEEYEERFLVCCKECGKNLNVREVSGWHVPLYDWG